jgi:membrane-associated phospholipid phosphatase
VGSVEDEEPKGLAVFLGASPQTPWVGFAEVWVKESFLRSRTMLLKRKGYKSLCGVCGRRRAKGLAVFLGASPQTPWVGFAEVWVKGSFLRSSTTLLKRKERR